MDQLTLIIESIWIALAFLLKGWWVYLPILLFSVALHSWRSYVRERYILSLRWVLLEIKPPPELLTTMRVAENFFSGLHGIYAKSLSEKKIFFEGKVPDWFSFEIVSNAGDMRFIIRCPDGIRNVVESVVFAQYPGAEISVLDEDYTQLLPASIPNEDYDLFGADLIFTKEDAYPIKTYLAFEEPGGKDEYRSVDPLAPLAEIMSLLGPGEHMWLQFVARPTGADWVKQNQKIVDGLVGKKPKIERTFAQRVFDILDAFIPGGSAGAPEDKKEEFNSQRLTPGQKFVLEQVENKLSKLAFKVTPRFIYIAKKDVFNRARVSAAIGMFKQLYLNNLNSFRPNSDTGVTPDGFLDWLFPSGNGFFKKEREHDRKVGMFKKYRTRSFPDSDKTVILNVEEMATLYHLPGKNVHAPATPRVEAKKGQPPINLPMASDQTENL